MARRGKKPPNILLVVFDQMSALSLPFHGHGVVQAPVMAGLARAGVVFEQAYCNSPLCSPSRHSMLTGCLPSRIGAYDNAAELPSAVPTLAHYLRAAGYRTCLSGKMDFTGADQLHGYEERLTTDLSPSDFGWTANWDEPRRIYDWFHSLQNVVEAGPIDQSMTMTYDEEATFQASRWLRNAASAKDRRPFFLSVAYMHPHDPYLGPRKFWERYADDEIDMPAIRPRPLARREAAARRLHALYDRGEYKVTEAHVRAARRAYYAMIDYVDDQLGRLLQTLRMTGQAEDTLVVVTSDHGDMLGERGLWYKMTFFERAVRVPLVIHAPGLFQPRRVEAPVSLVDLLPTLLEIAVGNTSLTRSLPMEGTSLLPAVAGKAAPAGVVHGEYMAEGTMQPMFMIRRGRLKFVSCAGDPPLLFDLDSDPLEQVNLATSSKQGKDARGFAAEVAEKWDSAALRQSIVESQRARRLVHGALTTGLVHPWDFEPRSDAAEAYYRNYGKPDAERRSRYPRAGRPPAKQTPRPTRN
jgi:choline-sulfatase